MSLAFEGETECVLHSSQTISYRQCVVESEGRLIVVYPEWSGSFSRFSLNCRIHSADKASEKDPGLGQLHVILLGSAENRINLWQKKQVEVHLRYHILYLYKEYGTIILVINYP